MSRRHPNPAQCLLDFTSAMPTEVCDDKDCDDGNPCTTLACDPVAVVAAPVALDDGASGAVG